MTDVLSASDFLAAGGVEDWRVIDGLACAHYATESYLAGVDLVVQIGRLAEEANHHPEIDLRYGGLTVRLFSHDVNSLSQRDVELARLISAAAAEAAAQSRPDQLK